jgi:hypothetical protein
MQKPIGLKIPRRLGLIVLASTCWLQGCQTLDRGAFGSFARSLNNQPYGYQVVADPTGSAPTPWVERFEVRGGDCARDQAWSDCDNDRERSELSGPKNNHAGTEAWYGWSLYLPLDYPDIAPTKVALGQFHQKDGPPAFMFQNLAGGLFIDRNFGHTTHMVKLLDDAHLRGRWNNIEVHAKWHETDGFFIVYVNGQERWSFQGTTMDAGPVYFKYGVYRSFLSRYKKHQGTSEVPRQIAYFANVKRGPSRVDLMPTVTRLSAPEH